MSRTPDTIKPPVLAIEWLLIRDKIRVNSDLKKEMLDEIDHRNIDPGTTVGLIARVIVHDHFFTLRLEGFPLVLVADFYDGNQGWIDTSGSAGTPGANGKIGLVGSASQTESRPGKPGTDGQPGVNGASASPITLVAATIHNAQLSALGGPGGAGGTGGNGGNGADGRSVAIQDKAEPIPPTDGGPGGDGNNGGVGGDGALITVHYLNSKGLLTMNSTGGAGGAKGQAGKGGKAGADKGKTATQAKDGAAGKPGMAGANGKPVTSVKTQHHTNKWDSILLTTLRKAADQWAAYRARVGEYAFRHLTLNSPNDGDIDLREFARNEFQAAGRLGPLTARALQLRQYLNNNLTPLGVPYNYVVMPDFPRFEKVITDYGPWVQILFSDALMLLQQTLDTEYLKKRLSIDLSHIDGMRKTLDLQLSAKVHEGEIVLMQIGHAKGRLAANKKAIEANQEAQAKERLEAADDYFYGLMGQIGAIVVAVLAAAETLGASFTLLAPAGLLATSEAAIVKGDSLESKFTVTKDGVTELKKEHKDAVGGLKEVIDGTKDFIDKYKTARDLMEAKVNGELQNAGKELLIRQLDLTFEVNLLSLKHNQTLLELAALQQELKTADDDYQMVGQFKNAVKEDIQYLGRITEALIRQAQSYADLLIKYTFYATRAFDLWTLQDHTSRFAFDCGYLHPDVVDRGFQAIARGDGSQVMKLLDQYLLSWSQLPNLIKLRDKYEDYTDLLVTETWFWSLTGPRWAATLKEQGHATFQTKLPEGRFEAKILNVAVALVGATAEDPSVTVVVEHTGEATVRRRDGQTITLHQAPRREPISATFDANDLGDLDEIERQQFWGRSPAAIWRVSIDSQSAANSKLDLTGLKELQFTVYYKCIFA